MLEDKLAAAGLLTTQRAAELLGTSVAYLRKLVLRGYLTPQREMGRLLFRQEELERYQREHRRLGSVRRIA